MAKNIKGITIEIGGDTSKLQKSLNAVNAPINKINKELKDLNQSLKLDPKNTELLAQKQEVLKRNIEASTEKLNKLKDAQKEMGSYAKLTDDQKAAFNRLSAEIAKSEDAIKSMNGELKSMSGIDLSRLTEGLKKAGDVALQVSKVVAASVGAIAVAVGKIVTDGIKSYAKLEQAQKGSERLFGKSFAIVKNNAAQAYQTLGLSATQYYDQVNTYAVGLKNALKGDTEQAAKLSNSILIAQSDIVAATGASQESVQNAFAAVMRGNYTMLDNLRIGIKGSKTGMEEVIQKVNAWNKAHGKATRYQMGNYADMQKALVDYVKMQGIAGTAQKQMSQTINGSLSQMKAAFDNFINGSGSVTELAKTIKNFLNNVLLALKELAPDLIKGLVSLFKSLVPTITGMMGELLPIIVEGAQEIIQGLIDFINEDSEQFTTMAVNILTNLVNFILQNLPILLEASIKIVSQLAVGIVKELPQLIKTAIECLLAMVNTLLNNIDKIIDTGIELLLGLVKGIIIAVPQLVQKLPEIIKKMAEGLKKGVSKIFEIGKYLIEGLWDGIKSMGNWLWEKVKGFGESVLGWFGDVLGISSPSKKMRWQGQMIGEGLALGIQDTTADVENAMSNLASGVEASVNPTINPTANTNPLYITIDKFYNNRETDIQQLAEELEFYRRNSALAKGGA